MILPDHLVDDMVKHSLENRGHRIVFKATRYEAVLPGEKNTIRVKVFCEGRLDGAPQTKNCPWVNEAHFLEGRVWNSG